MYVYKKRFILLQLIDRNTRVCNTPKLIVLHTDKVMQEKDRLTHVHEAVKSWASLRLFKI